MKVLKGDLLIASPAIIDDINFHRTIVLVAENDLGNGTIGFVINQKTNIYLSQLLDGCNLKHPVYHGGPVEHNSVSFVHRLGSRISNSYPIDDGLYWTVDYNAIINYTQKNDTTENDLRSFLGYSGWDVGQLERELEEKSWIVAKNKWKAKLLSLNSKQLWRDQMLNQGGNFQLWANSPDDPQLN